MAMRDFFQNIMEFFFGKPDPELIRLEGGKSTCSVCNEPIRGKSIYKVPLSDKHYCKGHAREEMDRVREQTFKIVPDGLTQKVHFTKEDGYHMICCQCSKKMHVMEKEWSMCEFCKEPVCKDDSIQHTCTQKIEAERLKKEQETPRRCFFCGTKIAADTAVRCEKCKNFFCHSHTVPEHHDCKSRNG
jgi:hypothetical protein